MGLQKRFRYEIKAIKIQDFNQTTHCFWNDVIAELSVIVAYFHMACLTYFSDPNRDGRFLHLQVGQCWSLWQSQPIENVHFGGPMVKMTLTSVQISKQCGTFVIVMNPTCKTYISLIQTFSGWHLGHCQLIPCKKETKITTWVLNSSSRRCLVSNSRMAHITK